MGGFGLMATNRIARRSGRVEGSLPFVLHFKQPRRHACIGQGPTVAIAWWLLRHGCVRRSDARNYLTHPAGVPFELAGGGGILVGLAVLGLFFK
jgi:hypothetical protein